MNAVARLSQDWLDWALAVGWQLGLLVALVALVSAVMGRFSARTRYALWLLVLVKALTPPTIYAPWGIGVWGIAPLFEHVQSGPPTADVTSAFSQMEPGDNAAFAFDDAERVLPPQSSGMSTTVAASASPGSEKTERPIRSVSQNGDSTTPRTASPRSTVNSETIAASLFVAWLLGALAFTCSMIVQQVRLARALRSARAIEEGPLRVALERLALKFGNRPAPELLVSDTVSSPLLFGLWRPRIVLPASLAETLDSDEIDDILLHELTHWRRRDLIVCWVQLLAQTILWFHPFLWFANARIRHERECACDETAIALGEGSPRRYGESLLKAVLAARARPAAALGFPGIFERGGRLQNRLEAVMNATPRNPLYRYLNWVFVAAFALVFFPMASCSVSSNARMDQVLDVQAKRWKGDEWLAQLNDTQRLYVEWAEKRYNEFFDRRDYSGLGEDRRKEMESVWLYLLRGSGNRDYYRSIDSLGAIRSRKAIAPLLELATSRNEKGGRARWMSVRALGAIGDESVVPELIPFVYHFDRPTRIWAQVSLVRLTGRNFGNDWSVWAEWWESQGENRSFPPEKVVWSDSDPCDPRLQAKGDARFVQKEISGLSEAESIEEVGDSPGD
ncbi:hypothetical protein JW916_12830 [Candidatus Sumerlaeota bacterium]|nr:hypothetical protein [Candidatus Sumerlaeota bacterium]